MSSIPTARRAAPGRAPIRSTVAYHDEEWGVPEYDDRALYEKLILDGFQAGLSWITILRKREAFRSRLRRLRSGAHRPLRQARRSKR